MAKLLHISASPRGEKSKSRAIALAHIDKRKAVDPSLEIDTIELWDEVLPQFDGDWAAAKMTLFGEGNMTDALEANWDLMTKISDRFLAADHYVLNIPMWNGSIPYRLKQYIDIITQPGVLYSFDPDKGYIGLLADKTAKVIVSSAVWAPGIDPGYGRDFQSNYMEWWLNKIGVSDTQVFRFQPSMLTPDPDAQYRAALENV